MLFLKSGNQSINASQAILNSSQSLSKITAAVALTETPILILGQSQPSGAPVGSDQGNCLQLAKTELGNQNKYSVTSQWDPNSGLFGIFLLNNNDCSTLPTSSNSVALSSYIFKMSQKGVPFFTGQATSSTGSVGVANTNIPSGSSGFFEINFNYGTQYGTGSISNGLVAATTRLTAPLLTSRACRIASPDLSWFTDFKSNLISSATVQISQNFDAAYDRLAYLGTPPAGLVVTNFNSIGVLHLYATSGLTVSNWLSVLGNVIWQRAPNAPTFQTTDPPRQFTFSLGEGLTFNPIKAPPNNYGAANHFYIPISLTTPLSTTGADNFAQSFCYPSFASSSDGFLGQSAVAPGSSCDSGGYPRLTGYLPTIISPGENNFMQNTLMKFIYPQSSPGTSAFTSNTTATSGSLWLGGWYGRQYLSSSNTNNLYRWIRGYELTLDSADTNAFADSSTAPQNLPGSAGKYFVKLSSGVSTGTLNNYLYFDVATGSWVTASSSNQTAGYQVVEFGDNAYAGNPTARPPNSEANLNLTLKLTKSVLQVPITFFQACQMNYSSQ